MTVLAQARAYAALGWAVLPIPHGTKHPSIDWKPFQTTAPTDAQLAEWFGADTGMGVVCGGVSGCLAVLDFDQPGSYDHWRKLCPELADRLPTDRRGDRYHVFLGTQAPVPSRDLLLRDWGGKAGELLGHGRLCVLPPTRHPSGEVRRWVVQPDGSLPVVALADLGVVVPDLQRESGSRAPTVPTETIREGERHSKLLSLAASLRARGYGETEVDTVVRSVNACQCQPPLGHRELDGIIAWALQKEPGELRHPLRGGVREDAVWTGPATSVPIVTPLGEDEPEEPWARLFQPLPDYLAEHESVSDRWVVEGLLPEGFLVVMGGTSKAGKSCLATALGMAVATGQPFLGMPTSEGSVLWLALEESEGERAEILRMYDQRPGNFYVTHSKLCIDATNDVEALRWWIRRTGARLVIVDPLYGATKAESLADGRAAREVLAPLKELCRTEGIAAVVLHHFRKSRGESVNRETFADSNQILAAASMDIRLEATTGTDGNREIKLSCNGRGRFANQTLLVRSASETEFALVSRCGSGGGSGALRDDGILQALRSASMTAEALAVVVGQPVKTVQNRLTRLKKLGAVLEVGQEGKAKVYGVPGLPELRELHGDN